MASSRREDPVPDLELIDIPQSNGTSFAGLPPSLDSYLNDVPPGRVVDMKLVDGNRSVSISVDTRSAGHGSAIASGGAGEGSVRVSGEGSGPSSELKEIYVSLSFKACKEVEGLDLGWQLMLQHYPLHREVHEEHGLVTYSQSERGKTVQNVYHVATMGLGTSVKQCVILMMNTKEDVGVVSRNWAATVKVGEFQTLVLAHTMDYVFCREKIQKGSATFYLYYVKKQGSETLRRNSWHALYIAVTKLDDVSNWATVVVGGIGQIAGFVLL